MKIETAKEVRAFLKMLKQTAHDRGKYQGWKDCEKEIDFVLGGLTVLKFLNRMDLMPAAMSLGYMTSNPTYSAVGLEDQYKAIKETEERNKKRNKKKDK